MLRPKDGKPFTKSQKMVLRDLYFRDRLRKDQLGLTRSDPLWILEGNGLIFNNIHNQWSITNSGREIVEKIMNW